MPTIISPIESLGLAGASLEGRIRRAANHVSDRTLARISARLNEHAVANEVVYERDGKFEPIRIMLRPLLAMGEQLTYVHHTCLQLIEALKRLPRLYLEDADVRRVLAITPGEESWLRDTWTPAHDRANSVYGRLDAVCDFRAAAWQDTLQFMEANLSGVGGIHYSPLAEKLVHDDIVPTLLAHDPALRIELPRDQRDLFVQVLIDHARNIGRANCRLCFVEPKYAEDGIAEQSVLSRYLSERHGLSIAHADPRELHIRGDEVFYEDSLIDVAYRDYETRDLIELEEELGKPLDAMRLLFRSNRMVSSMVGDFDHKSCWEILTDATLAEKFFNIEECRLFRRHVLWTRIVRPRRTSLPHNVEGDLLEYIRANREHLVMKPNRSYGGDGVTIGAATEPAAWERLLNEASAKGDDPRLSWVVQSATRLPVYDFPIIGEAGRVFTEPFYTVMGFAPTENGLGTMCRVSQKQVVNVAQHGGMAALLVAHAPDDLRMPKRSLKRTNGASQTLRKKITELKHLDGAIYLLQWDEDTGLAHGSRSERGDQLASLEALRHGLLVSDELGDLIGEAGDETAGDPRWQRELDLLNHERRRDLVLPEELVRHFAKAKSRSQAAWEDAREKNDFAIFAPALEKTLGLVREIASARGSGDPYDHLLDEYEPGLTRSRLEPVLTELRERLSQMVKSARPGPRPAIRERAFADDKQWRFCLDVLKAMGFDFERGATGRIIHPMTSGIGFDDVRVALRRKEPDLCAAILTTLHEGGHALYDQGYVAEDRNTLLATAPGMAMHEGQARLWENHVGRSPVFWRWLLPKLRECFGDALGGADAKAFSAAVNQIRPGPIRVTSDEVSYHLHIAMRYELEVGLVSGALSVKDLAGTWQERSTTLIGVTPPSDREGVLQDAHWAGGAFGYFPTYTIGSLYAAQLVETYEKSHKLEDQIGRGDFAPLLTWLRDNVHSAGSFLPAEDLMTRVTGKGLSPSAYFAHIERRHRA